MKVKPKAIKALVEKGYLSINEKKALDKILRELKALWPGVKVKIFGSKVEGVADEESDLDILVLLPCDVSEKIRKEIIYKIFDINLIYETNISPLIMSEGEWENGLVSLLPIHDFIEEEGVLL